MISFPQIHWIRRVPPRRAIRADEQRLTLRRIGKGQTDAVRESRLIEHIVFQFTVPEEPSGIVMFARVELESPKHTLTPEELVKYEEREEQYNRDLAEIQQMAEVQAGQ